MVDGEVLHRRRVEEEAAEAPIVVVVEGGMALAQQGELLLDHGSVAFAEPRRGGGREKPGAVVQRLDLDGVRELLESLDELEQMRCVLAHDDAADGDPRWAVATPAADRGDAAQDALEGAALPANAVVQRGVVAVDAHLETVDLLVHQPTGVLAEEMPVGIDGHDLAGPLEPGGDLAQRLDHEGLTTRERDDPGRRLGDPLRDLEQRRVVDPALVLPGVAVHAAIEAALCEDPDDRRRRRRNPEQAERIHPGSPVEGELLDRRELHPRDLRGVGPPWSGREPEDGRTRAA